MGLFDAIDNVLANVERSIDTEIEAKKSEFVYSEFKKNKRLYKHILNVIGTDDKQAVKLYLKILKPKISDSDRELYKTDLDNRLEFLGLKRCYGTLSLLIYYSYINSKNQFITGIISSIIITIISCLILYFFNSIVIFSIGISFAILIFIVKLLSKRMTLKSKHFFLRKQNEKLGPISIFELINKFDNNELQNDIEFWRKGYDDWIVFQKCEEVLRILNLFIESEKNLIVQPNKYKLNDVPPN